MNRLFFMGCFSGSSGAEYTIPAGSTLGDQVTAKRLDGVRRQRQDVDVLRVTCCWTIPHRTRRSRGAKNCPPTTDNGTAMKTIASALDNADRLS